MASNSGAEHPAAREVEQYSSRHHELEVAMSKIYRCKFAVCLSLTCLVLVTMSTVAVAQAGQLDPTFANKGPKGDSFCGRRLPLGRSAGAR